MFRWLNSLIDRIFAAIGGLVFLQVPQFYQQYTQRLAGHVDELKIMIGTITQAAEKNGKGLIAYIHKFLQHSDPDFASQGAMMKMMVDRESQLSNSLLAIQEAGPFSRPYYFVKNLNIDICWATLKDFQPGLMLTTEALLYALLGICAGVLLYKSIAFLFKWSIKLVVRLLPSYI